MLCHASRLTIAWPLFAVLVVLSAAARAEAPRQIGPDPQQYQQVVNRGIHYLETKGQAADGSFSANLGPGVTALVTTGLLRNGRSVDDPTVAHALHYLQGFVQKTGGIHAPDSPYQNYETSVSLMCFVAANKDHRYDKLIRNADAFLKGIQQTESQGVKPSDPAYGGAGYGKNKRPDLSNTQFFIEALVAAGSGPNDEALQKAIIFVSRCQKLETVHNTNWWAVKGPDGSFIYTAAAGGESAAKWENGKSIDAVRGLRGYGSMTYAGLKSLIYAGLKPDDPRVQAATAWIRKNYDVNANPGLGKQGLYYYYNTFAKTLHALGQDEFADASGKPHDWRRELFAALAKDQQADGSWVNSADRWLEGDPNLVSGYALLALSYCQPKAPSEKAK